MANHGFAGFDPEQTQAVIDATNSLAQRVEDTIAAAVDQFKLTLVSSDKVLNDCEYKDEVATGLTNSIEQVKEDINIKEAIDKFNAKVAEAEQLIGSTFARNTQNSEEAQQALKAQAKKAGANVGQ